MFYKPISAAVTSVTARWTGAGNNVGAIVYEISGADASTPADGSVNSNVSGSGITSVTSGSLTTANANDILIYGVRSQSNETTWTAGSGYTIPANGSNTRQGMQYGIVSSTQSGVTTSMSWNSGAPGAIGIFAAFKASGPSITATVGTPQSATLNTAFATPLQATVKDAGNNPVSGVIVTFTPPASGASGTFAGGVNTASTNAQGVATAATFTANSIAGGPYNVTASAAGVATTANFSLTNLISISPRVADLTFTRTQQFTASSPACWLVDGVVGGSAASGTITHTGPYTPPNTVRTHTLTAQAQSQSANATVYITNYPRTFMRDVDVFRTGQNLSETVLTPANVNQAQFGKLLSYSIDGVSDASPLYVANVNIPGQGFHNLAYAPTEHHTLYPFDPTGLLTN